MGDLLVLPILVAFPFTIILVVWFLARRRNSTLARLGMGGTFAASVVLPATLFVLALLTLDPDRTADSGEAWPLFVILIVPFSLALAVAIGGVSLAMVLSSPQESAGPNGAAEPGASA
jgi:hypothetical protein